MAMVDADWTVTRSNGNIRYVGDDHDGTSPSYATVIQFHRWLQALADDAVASGDDELDITNTNPSERAYDTIITLINNYNLDDAAVEHLFGGSILQDDGDTIYDGIVNYGNTSVTVQLIRDGAVIADDWWNHRDKVYGDGGLNYDDSQGISHQFMIKVRSDGVDIDQRKIYGTARQFGNTFEEFVINGTARGNNTLALATADDLNNETAIATVAGWTTITNTEGLRLIDVDNDGTDEEYWSEWNKASYTINQFYERMKWLTKEPVTEDSSSDSGSNFVVDNATITGAAQSFSVGSNAMLITKIAVNLKIGAGTPSGNLLAKIYTHSGTYGSSSVPNGQSGSDSDPYDSALLTADYERVTFNFPTPVSVAASTYYCVVIEHADGAVGDYVHIEGLASSGTHGGNRSHNTAGWTAVAADDLAFEVYTAPMINSIPGNLMRGANHHLVYDAETGGIAVATNDRLVFGTNIYCPTNSGTFLVGEAVHEDTATPVWKGRVLAWDPTNDYLLVAVETGTVTASDTFEGQTSLATGTVTSKTDPQAGSGFGGEIIIYAVDDDGSAGNLYGQLLKGGSPADNELLYDKTDLTDYVTLSADASTYDLSTPFCGSSTGSAIVGSYGFGIEYADLTSADKLFDLTNTLQEPPNNVQNTVKGLATNEDYVLVAPWDGVSYDDNNDPAIDKDQLSLDTILDADNETQVEVTESIPSDTPNSGYIRVTDDLGFERRLHYQNWENGTPNRFYNIDTNDGNEDFLGDEAAVGNDVYISYIDQLITSGTELSYTSVQSGSRDLVVIVRDGQASSPIKQFIAEWSQTDTNQTINAIRTSDL